jgi:hypothetical protein
MQSCRMTPEQKTKRRAKTRCALKIAVVWFLFAFGGLSQVSWAQIGQAVRTVQGRVLDSEEKPQPNAVVYLENEKSLEVKTYITTQDGAYRFGQLASDVDYQLWAKYQGSKSKTRSISSFDSKKQFNFDLKLEPVK